MFVRVTHAEATSVAAWLLAPERVERLKRFREQVARWRAAVGPGVAQLEELVTKHDSLPPPEPELRPCVEAYRTCSRRKLMCPFNADDGSWEIYPSRPVACRAFHVADTSEYCSADANREASVLHQARLIEIVRLARGVLKGLSAAAGHDTESALPAGLERGLSVMEGALR